MYLLDTNILSDLVRRPDGAIADRIRRIGEHTIATSVIVAAELRFGAERRGSEQLSSRLDAILGLLPVLPLGDDADRHYARLRTVLERQGRPIGSNDMLIAAHALATQRILVTDNVGEFARVPDLVIENWLRDR